MEKIEYNEPATQKQVAFMRQLNIDPTNLTKTGARVAIDKALNKTEERDDGMPRPIKPDREKSIVAQCLTKCFYRNKEAADLGSVLGTYNFFLENL